MSYTSYDFSESLASVSVDRTEIEAVVAAWGESPDGYGSWEGGFLMLHKDGRFAYVTGWADTSGWGCRDGASVHYFPALPDRASLPGPYGGDDPGLVGERAWDEEPADLNRFVLDGEVKW